MSEQHQHNDFLPPAPAEQEVVVLIKKIQQQLVFLEKKIDTLIDQSKSGSFSRPHQRFDRKYDNSSRGKDFYPSRHFGKPHGGESRGFGHEKKVYEHTQEGEPGKERQFNKRYDGKKKRFEQKNKPFFFKRRDRGS